MTPNNFRIKNGLTVSNGVTISAGNVVITSGQLVIGATAINATSMSDSASNAYSNAVTYTDTKIGTANTAMVANAGAAYTNAIAIAANGSNITSGTVAFARIPTSDSVSNTSISHVPTANNVKTAYDAAITANTNAQTALTAAGSAYSNGVTYTDTKIGTANTAMVANAGAAYTNAIAIAANGSNITSGTVAFARLPSLFVGTTTIQSTSAAQAVTGITTLAAGNTTITGDITVSGNLTINGTTTNINSTNLVVEDKNIVLADVTTPTDVTADGGGITLKGATDKTFNWVDATDSWTSSEHIDLAAGKVYKIGTTTIANSTALGTGILASSLTSVGTLSSLTLGGAVSGITTLAAGSTTITGFANVSTSVNSAALSVGTSFIANTTQVTIAAGVPLSANGGTGTAGQVLASNGSTGSPYWSTTSYVQQGTGTGQGTNIVKIGWSNSVNGSASLRLTIDATDFANTWPISISGTANVATYLSSTQQLNMIAGVTSASTDVNTANDTGSFSARGNTTTVASMSFHRAGAYAINMGLGTDNVFRIGGWSASNNAFQLSGTGALTLLSSLTIGGAASGITTLAAGNTTITGFTNVSTTLQVGGISTLAANLVMANNFITRPVLAGYSEHEVSNAAVTGTFTLDFSTANFFDLILTGNTTISPSGVPANTRMVSATLVAKQDATGGRTITWPTGTKYAGGVSPPATTTANAIDIWSIMTYDAGNTYIVSLSVKGAA